MAPNLHEVFGIRNEIPTLTYVDRAGLDHKLEYFLGAERHIVIHGASKQGKSSLRKKALSPQNVIVIQCLPELNGDDIIKAAMRELGASIPASTKSSETKQNEASGEVEAGLSIPLFGSGKGKAGGKVGNSNNEEKASVAVSGYDIDLSFLAKRVLESGRRLVIEDFHYFSEDARKDMAFKLKALYELGIHVVVVGIWAEQNLLTFYNGDLSGRVEEIDISWSKTELLQVLEKGSKELNITISTEIAEGIISASYDNVGLTQRLAERVCYEAGIFERQSLTTMISDKKFLDSAIENIVADLSQRYSKIAEVFFRGFQETELKVYQLLFRAIVECPVEQLLDGIPQDQLLDLVSRYDGRIRGSDLTSALSRIERLQSSRGVTPLLVSYNNNLRAISLADREFLFFRRFGKPNWSWQNDNQPFQGAS